METAHIAEIFTSVQGEGPWVGSRTLFVRFAGCGLRCRWCDEPGALIRTPRCRVEEIPGRRTYRDVPNPLTASQLGRFVSSIVRRGGPHPYLSLTGGEPLEQHEFLRAWLPKVRRRFRTYLETSGVLVQALRNVLPWIDLVSMDMKPPSSAATGEFWEQHLRFLRLAARKEASVKVVVTADTDRLEVLKCALLTRQVDSAIPFVLQPVTPHGVVHEPPSTQMVENLQRDCLKVLRDVRIIPQVHRALGIP